MYSIIILYLYLFLILRIIAKEELIVKTVYIDIELKKEKYYKMSYCKINTNYGEICCDINKTWFVLVNDGFHDISCGNSIVLYDPKQNIIKTNNLNYKCEGIIQIKGNNKIKCNTPYPF